MKFLVIGREGVEKIVTTGKIKGIRNRLTREENAGWFGSGMGEDK